MFKIEPAVKQIAMNLARTQPGCLSPSLDIGENMHVPSWLIFVSEAERLFRQQQATVEVPIPRHKAL